MFGGRFSLRRGPPDENAELIADLKRATESNVIEVPPALLGSILEASQKGEDQRRVIMQHLRECLAEPSGKRWRRIYAALLLLEDLVGNGSPDLMIEAAEGRHFDIAQRLSLLQVFDCANDKRAQTMIRNKASSLRNLVVTKLESTAVSAIDSSRAAETTKPSSPGNANPLSSVPSFSTTASTVGSNDYNLNSRPEASKGDMILNGIVVVGHRCDTDTESSGDDNAIRPAVAYREKVLKSTSERNQQLKSSQGAQPAAALATAGESMDLLNL
eukprot:TRINITY_DN1659_c0_g2_i1.p1 TRINITY_DN1659_c0_g2~~TRINITY_DN1659_c0_g2_i1.p1  ORF type:complete len:272 (-),score=56.14 TRINITY_DN1659_c0_g2_i1:256-1071(-)